MPFRGNLARRIGYPVYRYLFGPVPSRRLGISLGVDLVPAKTCSFDCIFCQVGRTVTLVTERKEYVPVSEVKDEIRDWINRGGKADFITLAGSGEPTLNSGFGSVIDAIHDLSHVRTALLSNGSLFHLPEVRSAASKADLVKVSLGAWDRFSFEKLNKPHSDIKFASVLEGLRLFGKDYDGELWLEVFVVAGINDSQDSIRRIAGLARDVRPDHIHLNTVVRPPADSSAMPVSPELLERLAALFSPVAEVIPGSSAGKAQPISGGEKNVAGLLARHPCTIKDVAVLFGGDSARAESVLMKMVARGVVRIEKHGEVEFYTTVLR